MPTPTLKLEAVSKRYDGVASPILNGVNLVVEGGASLAITGPSGCGKSTLLNIMGGLDRPTGGTVSVGPRQLGTLSEGELAAYRNASVGFVFQHHHLLPQLSALENVLIPTLAHANADHRRSAPDQARALLKRVGLGERLGHRPARLSGGERQRVALVRALINDPVLLLADEPTGSLDPAAFEEVAILLDELHRERNVTLIVVTHSDELARRMQRVLPLRAGQLQHEGPGR